MSILAYNGGLVVAMTGKNCVAIAADTRLGVRGQTIATDFQKIFEMGPRLYVGLPGLVTDSLTVAQKLKFRLNMYELRENRQIKPPTFAAMLSNILYERRFGPYFVQPIIAGLDPVTYKPYVYGMDVIGSTDDTEHFATAGTSAEPAFGMCEVLWEPDLSPDDLFEKISQALINAFDRDCIAGWGGTVYVIEKDKVTVRSLKTRMD